MMSIRWIKSPRDIFAGGEVVKADTPTAVPEMIADALISQMLAFETEAPKKRGKKQGEDGGKQPEGNPEGSPASDPEGGKQPEGDPDGDPDGGKQPDGNPDGGENV